MCFSRHGQRKGQETRHGHFEHPRQASITWQGAGVTGLRHFPEVVSKVEVRLLLVPLALPDGAEFKMRPNAMTR